MFNRAGALIQIFTLFTIQWLKLCISGMRNMTKHFVIFFQILDATFDDLLPLAIPRMPASFGEYLLPLVIPRMPASFGEYNIC